eukprot:768259-Prymnesium_polylepis.1
MTWSSGADCAPPPGASPLPLAWPCRLRAGHGLMSHETCEMCLAAYVTRVGLLVRALFQGTLHALLRLPQSPPKSSTHEPNIDQDDVP